MSSTFISNAFKFILFLSMQLLLFNNMEFGRFVLSFPYILFIILYPANGSKNWLLFMSFVLGFTLDLFGNSGGVHAVACISLAFIRPYLLKFSFGHSYEFQTVQLNTGLTLPRLSFILISIVIHHTILFFLEAFRITLFFEVLLRIILSSFFTLVSCILIIYITKPSKK